MECAVSAGRAVNFARGRRGARVLVAVILVVGCATSAKHLNELSLGMTKQQVIQILGDPDRTEAEGQEERLYYWLSESRVTEAMFGGLMRGLNLGKGQYRVTLTDGRVTSYKKVARGQ